MRSALRPCSRVAQESNVRDSPRPPNCRSSGNGQADASLLVWFSPATPARGPPMPTREKPDAIAMLKEDHRKVEDLFEKAEKARDEDRKKMLVQQICTELMIHSMVEEEI